MKHNKLAVLPKSDEDSPVRQKQDTMPSSNALPSSKSFTFSLSDFWKPARDPIIQWIRDLPGPVQNEKPIEPAHYHTLKHSLRRDDSDNNSAEHARRCKRARTISGIVRQSSAESGESKILGSGHGLARRFSDVCRRVVRGPSPAPRCDMTPAPTPSPGTPSFALIDRPKMRFVCVGDSQCGKSSMLLRFYRNTYNLDYSPTKFELFHKIIEVDKQDTDIEIWDTAGDVTLEQLGRLNYLAWDAVFLCFSVNSMRSFNHARTQWITQIRKHTRGAPLILVGTKTDERVGPSLWAPLYPNPEARVTATEGSMTATALGAVRYVECSAKTGQGINGVFEEGVRAVFDYRAAIEKSLKKRTLPGWRMCG